MAEPAHSATRLLATQQQELDAAHRKRQSQDNREWLRAGSCEEPPHDLGCCHCCCPTCSQDQDFQDLIAVVVQSTRHGDEQLERSFASRRSRGVSRQP